MAQATEISNERFRPIFGNQVAMATQVPVYDLSNSHKIIKTSTTFRNKDPPVFSDPIPTSTGQPDFKLKNERKWMCKSDSDLCQGQFDIVLNNNHGSCGDKPSSAKSSKDSGFETSGLKSKASSARSRHSRPLNLPRKLCQILAWKEVIGHGTFGDVYRAHWHDAQREIAVKIVKLSRDSDMENHKREIKIWKDLRHMSLLRLYKYYYHSGTETVYMFMELAQHGSLFDYICTSRKNKTMLDIQVIVDWGADVLQGLGYLHEKRIVHRDLKSPNVVLCKTHVRNTYRAKICDFGTSRIMDHTTQATGMIGSTRWMAPEVMRGEKYNCKCDIYSFGMMFWEMLTCQVPFQNKTNPYALMWSVCEFNERPPTPDTSDWNKTRKQLLADVVEACWVLDAERRPSPMELWEKLVMYRE